ncbi:hypothetical protein BJ508DRAFT_324874 [Ascobolus immersus RN42]|uniref:Uncharacterized protein n=1 Tax=Ascobolus immersus RN42 TaxID=1160509 RepID=A0A3N4IA82_ASCIM|nr:hypothetical protein BJ508DRAFT_324874 [Ascobolus immersus RN42]
MSGFSCISFSSLELVRLTTNAVLSLNLLNTSSPSNTSLSLIPRRTRPTNQRSMSEPYLNSETGEGTFSLLPHPPPGTGHRATSVARGLRTAGKGTVSAYWAARLPRDRPVNYPVAKWIQDVSLGRVSKMLAKLEKCRRKFVVATTAAETRKRGTEGVAESPSVLSSLWPAHPTTATTAIIATTRTGLPESSWRPDVTNRELTTLLPHSGLKPPHRRAKSEERWAPRFNTPSMTQISARHGLLDMPNIKRS